MKLSPRSFNIKEFDEPGMAEKLNNYLDEIREAVMTRIDYQQAFIIQSAQVVGDEFRVVHNLGYIPNNFVILSKSGAGEIYPSGGAWTPTAAFFKCTTAGLIMRIAIW